MSDILPPLSTNPTAERILREAWELFQTKGYRGVSMDELCLRSGVTKPTLYYYFQNKEVLYVQTMLHQLRGFRAIVERDAPLAVRLHELAAAFIGHFQVSVPMMLRDMEHINEKRYQQIVDEAFTREFLAPVVAAMDAAIARGELRPGDGTFYAWAYLGLVNTFVGRNRVPAGSVQSVAAKLTALFLDGARATHNEL
ncbi:MAG: TetR/AcrR family transcriptional regulator [Roseiflexaceae bacterium]|nr:TetR/AcrR family transcriptional regulator [Roseiflexaceae bacterium]